MSTEIFWTPLAKASYLNIVTSLQENWSEKVRSKFESIVDKRIAQLLKNPRLAPLHKHYNFRKLVIHKHVSLFYTLEENKVIILLLWDNRTDPEQFSKTLGDDNYIL